MLQVTFEITELENWISCQAGKDQSCILYGVFILFKEDADFSFSKLSLSVNCLS